MNQMLHDRRNFVMTLSGIFSGLLLLQPQTAGAREKIRNLLSRIDRDRLPHSRPTRAPHIFWQEQNQRLVRLQKGKAAPLCRLNPTAKTIWESCNGRLTLTDISTIVSRTYQVSPHQAYVDCLVFLTRLGAVGAITL